MRFNNVQTELEAVVNHPNLPSHIFADTCPLSLVQDTKISSLERNIRDLEDEVQMLKTSSLLHPDDRQEELKHVEVYKSHSKFMKTKVERLLHAPTCLHGA